MTSRCTFLTFGVLGLGLQAAVFNVSPAGNDAGPGSKKQPFATVQRAQRAVRDTIKSGLTDNVIVYLADGVYELTEPLSFGSRDGGTRDFSVTYTALPGASPVLSGGCRVAGWRPIAGGKLWEASLPVARDKNWAPRQLFINGRRGRRARWPNADATPAYCRLKGASLAADRSVYTVTLNPADVAAWGNVADIEVVVCGNWEITRKKLQGVDPDTGVLTLAPPHAGSHPAIRPAPGRFAFLENAREFLDQPGEWYLDRQRGVITYWPRSGEVLPACTVVVPRLTRLLEVRGRAGIPVRNLHFRGVRFCYADWAFPVYGFNGVQASFHTFPKKGQKGWDWSPWVCTEAALVWEFAEDCSLQDGAFEGLGGVGLHLFRGCHRNVIEGNLVQQIGASGIMVGENLVGFPWGKKKLPPGELPTANRIANNLVRRCGLDDYGAVGIWVSFTDGTEIAHNLVCDLPYSGISLGWMWNEKPTDNRNNVVVGNEVHTVMQKLCDGGCLYTLGRQPGTVIRANLFHGARRSETAQGAPNNGIFFDQGSMGFRVEDNCIYDTSGALIRFNQCKKEWHTWHGNRFGMPRAAPGIIGAGLLCDGRSSCIDVPHTPELDPSELTAEAWVYLDRWVARGDKRRWIVNKNDDEWVEGHWALVTAGPKAGAYLNIGGGRKNCFEAWSKGDVLSLHTWHYLAFTYDGKDLCVYVDGAKVAETLVNRRRKPGNTSLAIGRRQDAYNYFLGVLDEVRLFSRALSPSEIVARARSRGAAPPTDLPVAGHWGFEALDKTLKTITAGKAETGLQAPYRERLLR